MGSKEKSLIRQAKQAGMPIPDRILNKPFLSWGLDLYLIAYYELQFDRNQNDNIPWSVIINYSAHNELNREQTERLIYFIRELDRVFKEWLNNKGPKNHGKPSVS